MACGQFPSSCRMLHIIHMQCSCLCILRAPGIDLLLFTLNIYPMRGRLQLLQIAVLLYRNCNLAIQQLNCQVMLCHWVVSWSSLPAQRPPSWKTPSLSMWTTRSNCISLTSWQRFSSCTEQQKPVSTSYGLKMVHKFAPNTQSLISF